MTGVRRAAAVFLTLGTFVLAACGSNGGVVAHGRQGSWQRIVDPAFAGGRAYALGGVAAPGDGYPAWTAAGSTGGDRPGSGAAEVWSSTDGIHWASVVLDVGGARVSVANAAARRGGRAVVVGSAASPEGDRDGRIWTSTDGAFWGPVDLDPSVLGGPGDEEITAVAAGPLGFVAAGVERRDGHAVPAVWTSPDGLAWAREAAATGGPFLDGEAIRGVAVGPSGAVAVGTVRTGGETDGMAWFSADGAAWRTVPLGAAGFAAPATQSVNAVTATAGGFVAVGEDANGDRRAAVASTSADGITWQRQPPSPDMAELADTDATEGVSADDVAGAGPVFAVGGSGAATQVWTSADGRRWARDTSFSGDAGPDEIATDGRSVLVVLGGSNLWFRTASGTWADVATDKTVFPSASTGASIFGPVTIGDAVVALGSTGGDRGTWTSTDRGRSWAFRTPFGTGRAAGLAAGSLLVAGGWDSRPGVDQAAAVWVSADGGGSWQRTDSDNPAFSLRPVTQIFGVGTGGPGFVAVGLDYDLHEPIHAHAWYSADGRRWKRANEPPAWSGPGDSLLSVACPLPDGGVVALGTTTVHGEQDVWAWVSHDGVTWQQATGPGAALLGGAGRQFAGACAPTRTGVLAAGVSGAGGVVWSTADGFTWTTVGGPATFAAPEADVLYGIAVDGDRRVVTGRDGSDMVVFTSRDAGATWTKRTAAGFGGFGLQIGDPVILEDEAMVVGSDGPGAGVWIGPAA